VARLAHQIEQDLKVELTDNQFCACISLGYNIGHANFAGSTLLKDINNSQFEAAAKEFLRWNHAQGKVISGLTERRQAEMELFLS
jgi:lysozyme